MTLYDTALIIEDQPRVFQKSRLLTALAVLISNVDAKFQNVAFLELVRRTLYALFTQSIAVNKGPVAGLEVLYVHLCEGAEYNPIGKPLDPWHAMCIAVIPIYIVWSENSRAKLRCPHRFNLSANVPCPSRHKSGRELAKAPYCQRSHWTRLVPSWLTSVDPQ